MRYLLLVGLLFSSVSHAAEFQQVLEDIGNNHARVKSAQFSALAQKSAQLSKQFAWSPSVYAQASHPIREWGADAGEGASLTAKMNLFRFGADGSAYLEAKKSDEQADIKSRLASVDVEEKAAQIIFEWIELQRLVENQKALLNGKRELVRVAQARYKRGELPAQEVAKVGLDASNAEVQIRQAEVELLNLKSTLDSYLPGASELNAWPWQALAANSASEKKTKKMGERWEFKKLQLESELYGHQAWQATSDWLPRLDLTSTWATDTTSPVGHGDWNALVTLTIPLWDRGQALADRRVALNLQGAAQSDLRDYENVEQGKLRTLSERREKLKQNLVAALQADEKAKTLAVDSLRRFQLGRASVNDLLVDQARVYDAETLAQQASKQFHLVLLEACLAADERPSHCYK